MRLFLLASGLPYLAQANVEKVIFTAPDSLDLQNLRSGFSVINIERLSPSLTSYRAVAPVVFPAQSTPTGLSSWYILDQLLPGHRYELRVCWVATEPTQFSIYTHSIDRVLSTPELFSDLTNFSEYSLTSSGHSKTGGRPEGFLDTPSQAEQKSALFLQIYAAADFYTVNETLMSHPLPVQFDIVLDHYTLGILPQSLATTLLYVLLLLLGSWYLSDYIWIWLRRVSNGSKDHTA